MDLESSRERESRGLIGCRMEAEGSSQDMCRIMLCLLQSVEEERNVDFGIG